MGLERPLVLVAPRGEQRFSTTDRIGYLGKVRMLLQVVIVAVFLLTLLALLMFIWPRRKSLRRLLGGGAGSYIGGEYIGSEGHSPHTSAGDGGGADGASGDC